MAAEDDALVASGLRNLLQELGVRMHTFPNVEEALVSAFIVDYSLGGKRNGLEVLQVVQQTR